MPLLSLFHRKYKHVLVLVFIYSVLLLQIYHDDEQQYLALREAGLQEEKIIT